MSKHSPIIRANCEQLRTGLDLISQLPTGSYNLCIETLMPSTIGQHVRHVIEHYDSFVSGIANNFIDYSARGRDLRTEADARFGSQRMREIAVATERINTESVDGLLVVHEPVDGPSKPAESSVRRELEFLLSHTAHHYALIAVLARAQGVAVPAEFGLARSTVVHRRQSSDTQQDAVARR